MTIDASEHIRLVSRVIGQMNLRGDEAEEAFGEGQVALVKAAKSFNPAAGKPLANWLANNVRWDIKDWRRRQKYTLSLKNTYISQNNQAVIRSEFAEIIEKMEKMLTPLEYQVILAGAWGYSGREIARTLEITPVKVSKTKKKAREKLEALRK